MSKTRRRVLFVSHSASLNGASLLLLDFLRWLRPRVDWEIEILIHGGGPLLQAFASLAKTRVWRDPAPLLTLIRLPKPLRHLAQRLLAWLQLPTKRFDLVYANTTAAALLVEWMPPVERPLVWHVHELPYAMASTLNRPGRSDVFLAASRFIAVSDAVRTALIDRQGVDPSLIDVVHGFARTDHRTHGELRRLRDRLRSELGIPPDAFVVGGCGSLGWRKGTDLFLRVAHEAIVRGSSGGLFFLWVGGDAHSNEAAEFRHDMRHLGIDQECRLIPSTRDAADYYCAMDVFALTSREDPFPLVVLEAAERSVPTLCFQSAGGAVEFVGQDAGISVPYLDTRAFADAIHALMANPDMTLRLGQRAKRRVRDSLDPEEQCAKLLRCMERCMTADGTTRSGESFVPFVQSGRH